MKTRCRHERNAWILGGTWEWCYRCGALRGLALIPGTSNHLKSITGWRIPCGPEGDNPMEFPGERKRVKP
jgi:hypothetical protein